MYNMYKDPPLFIVVYRAAVYLPHENVNSRISEYTHTELPPITKASCAAAAAGRRGRIL